ncbi:hypothetical protein I5E45_10400 [Pseudomonas aeruginosa]|uniref:hypothetical protein n=1 Tax=Pseudomonas aeruginosa TaxID=287 RepID=UPI00053E5D0B|nr:hypothetical protein [Pseudomonas aeruginosa]EKY1861014.1 hypothetical protein [Pseudomonas aeruginosa]MBG5552186.1 hypothetical protein [Pseudomonas aeruginosa]MBH3707095.1 hypothetical protein [Pseudomonas aeruginosa]MBH4373966.1 hypothetical protein [Pseudomonas aeruginosa]MBN5526746.1 hypothetical protein [Pseudomonas aeruginosa]
MIKRTLYHFHFCCGLGGGAAGFNRARPRVGNVEAEWVCLGGIDVDPAGFHGAELLAEQGETFMLSNTPIWVRPVAVALSVAQQEVQP